jgi:Ser/Thr protein kinase RdoA (MazF antagonist)
MEAEANARKLQREAERAELEAEERKAQKDAERRATVELELKQVCIVHSDVTSILRPSRRMTLSFW